MTGGTNWPSAGRATGSTDVGAVLAQLSALAAEPPEFPVAFKGYDAEAVDDHVGRVRQLVAGLAPLLEELAGRATAGEQAADVRLQEAEERANAVAKAIVRRAREEAERIVSAARASTPGS